MPTSPQWCERGCVGAPRTPWTRQRSPDCSRMGGGSARRERSAAEQGHLCGEVVLPAGVRAAHRNSGHYARVTGSRLVVAWRRQQVFRQLQVASGVLTIANKRNPYAVRDRFGSPVACCATWGGPSPSQDPDRCSWARRPACRSKVRNDCHTRRRAATSVGRRSAQAWLSGWATQGLRDDVPHPGVAQVFRLAHATWRGFTARSKPATLVYGEQLAGLVGHLADVQLRIPITSATICAPTCASVSASADSLHLIPHRPPATSCGASDWCGSASATLLAAVAATGHSGAHREQAVGGVHCCCPRGY
jgi:hypothetical protein